MYAYIFPHSFVLQAQLASNPLHCLQGQVTEFVERESGDFAFTNSVTVGSGGKGFLLDAFAHRFRFDAGQLFIRINQGCCDNQAGDCFSRGKQMVKLRAERGSGCMQRTMAWMSTRGVNS